MVISSKHKFIFIHIPKCAGTSIRIALDPYGRKDNRSPLTFLANHLLKPKKQIPKPFYMFNKLENHCSAQLFRECLPDRIWNSYYKFAFVRNPFDWQVSHYHYILDHPVHTNHTEVMNCGSFTEYLKLECNENLTSSPNPLSHYVCNQDNTIIVDFIGKVESLENDFKAVSDALGISVSIPHLNRSKHRDYRSCYSDSDMELVIQHHEADFINFDYSRTL